MKIYLATSWRNIDHSRVLELLRWHGHEVYDFKNPPNGVPGFQWTAIHSDFKSLSAEKQRNLIESHPKAALGFNNDFRAMRWADACVLLLPSGRSAHLEGGWFSGANKRLVIYTRDGEEPELMNMLASQVVVSDSELLAALE